MKATLALTAALSIFLSCPNAQAQADDSTTPKTTTERPNMSMPGLQETLSGVLMDASCRAIADERSDLTKTPRLVPPPSARNPDLRRGTDRAVTERAEAANTVSESAVPERYRNCGLRSATTSFALLANGRIYVLDRVSNQMMQEHMLKTASSASGRNSSAWRTITVTGTPTSDHILTLRSVGKPVGK